MPKQEVVQTRNRLRDAIVLVMILASIGILAALQPQITGFLGVQDTATYTDNFRVEFDKNTTLEWSPTELGSLTSIGISGTYEGDGIAEVYLVVNDTRSLIYSTIEPSLSTITVRAVDNLSNSTELNTSNITAPLNSSNVSIINETNTTINNTIVNTTNTTVNETVENNSTNTSEQIPIVDSTPTITTFNNTCAQTCAVFLDESPYTLEVLLTDGTLTLDSIAYTIQTQSDFTVLQPQPVIYNTSAVPLEVVSGANLSYRLDNGPEIDFTSPTTILVTNGLHTITIIENNGDETRVDAVAFSVLARDAPQLTEQGIARVGEKVLWKKSVVRSTPGSVTLSLPESAENISVLRDKAVDITSRANIDRRGVRSSVIDHSRTRSRVFSLAADSENVSLVIDDPVTDIEVKYTTKAPTSSEEIISSDRKIVTVSSDVHYTNVIAFANITEDPKHDKVTINWLLEGSSIRIDNTTVFDTDNNGMIDYVEWVVPHLSDQRFEIVVGGVNRNVSRGKTWNTVCEDGKCRSISTNVPINWHNGSEFVPINLSLADQSITIAGRDYTKGVGNGSYEAYFRDRSSDVINRPVAMRWNGVTITLSPVDFITFEPHKGTVQGRVGNRVRSDVVVNDNIATYPDQYDKVGSSGSFANLSFEYHNTFLKENLIISDQDFLTDRFISQVDPEDFNITHLVFGSTIRAYDTDDQNANTLGVVYGSSRTSFKDFGLAANDEITTTEVIEFTDSSGDTIYIIPEMIAIDSVGQQITLNKTLSMTAFGNLRIDILTPFWWLNSTDRVYPIIIDPTIEQNISDGSDDARSTSDGGFPGYSDSATDCRAGFEAGGSRDIMCGLRFLANIPAGATIDHANISGKTSVGIGGNIDLLICGDTKLNDPPTFSSDHTPHDRFENLTDCTRWDAATFSFQGTYETPDISATVQAIIDHSDWASGDHLVITINGSDEASNFDDVLFAAQESSLADSVAVLFVEYTEEAGASDDNGSLSVVWNNPLSYSVSQNDTVNLNATATCSGDGDCYEVNFTSFYNFSGLAIDDLINTTVLGIPVSNATGVTNLSCGYLNQDQSCSINITLNLTGLGNFSFTFNASTNSTVEQNATPILSINISIPETDINGPTFTIEQPNQHNVSSILYINATISDATAVDVASAIIYNTTDNVTDWIELTRAQGTDQMGAWNATYDVSALLEGIYNITVNATDTLGFSSISSNSSFVMDTTSPIALAVFPSNGSNFQDENILINITTNDTFTGVQFLSVRLSSPTTQGDWELTTFSEGENLNSSWTTTISSVSLSNDVYNITVNATDFAGNQMLANVSSISVDNQESFGSTIIADSDQVLSAPQQRNSFWDGDNWFVFYHHLASNTHYNYTSDGTTWVAGHNVIETDMNPVNSIDVEFNVINGFKTWALIGGQDISKAGLNITRGNITQDNFLNLTHASYEDPNIDGMGRIQRDTRGHYWISSITSGFFGSLSTNISLYPDNGSDWNINDGTPLNTSGPSFGANFPRSLLTMHENGVVMEVGVHTSIIARNFTPDGHIWSSSNTIATNEDNRNDFDTVVYNESGSLNTHLVYVDSDRSGIHHYRSESSDSDDWTFLQVVPYIPKDSQGIVLTTNDTHLIMTYINETESAQRIQYQVFNGSNWTIPTVVVTNTHNKTTVSSSDKSNNTHFMVAWNSGNDDIGYNLTTKLVQHATPSAPLIITPSVAIDFTLNTEANNAIVERNWTLVNLSVSNDTTIDTISLDWNGTNYTIWGKDLIGIWNFNEDTNDSSGNNMDGSVTGTVDCTTDGYFAQACDFEGSNDYVDTGTSQLYDLNTQFTVEAWINPDSFGPQTAAAIADYGDSDASPSGWVFAINDFTATNALTLAHNLNSNWDPANSESNTISLGTWQHVAATYDNGAVVLYVNGTQRGAGNIGSFDKESGHNLLIGIREDLQYDFDGQIDTLRIWNRTLTGEEINFTYRTEIGRFYTNISKNTFGTNISYQAHINLTNGIHNQTEVRNISFQVAQSAPVIYNVTPVTLTPLAGDVTFINISFNVSDSDGAANLDDSTAMVNVSLTENYFRTNDSGNCRIEQASFNGGTDRSYSCLVPVYYYDNASSDWIINVSIVDSDGLSARNESQTVTVNFISSIELTSDSIESSSTLGVDDNELSFTINNTGNFEFTSLNITAYDLNATITDLFRLAGNFSLNATSSGSGFGLTLENGTGTNITTNDTFPLSIELPKTNYTGGSGTKQAYIYIDLPNDKGLSSAVTYNATKAWELWAR